MLSYTLKNKAHFNNKAKESKMINFQRIIDEYKKAKRCHVKNVMENFSSAKKECLKEKDFPLLKFERCAYNLGRFVNNMQKDLKKEIPLLIESKEKLKQSKQQRLKGETAVAMKNLCKAEEFFLQFKEEKFEKYLTIALKKSLKEAQL